MIRKKIKRSEITSELRPYLGVLNNHYDRYRKGFIDKEMFDHLVTVIEKKCEESIVKTRLLRRKDKKDIDIFIGGLREFINVIKVMKADPLAVDKIEFHALKGDELLKEYQRLALS
jgi:hypothetical protein